MRNYKIGDLVTVLSKDEALKLDSDWRVWWAPEMSDMSGKTYPIVGVSDGGLVTLFSNETGYSWTFSPLWLAPAFTIRNSFNPELDEANRSAGYARSLRDKMLGSR